ncbi:hypothetical protein Y032_0145g2484 [Ancylostoma ceylanicum]|uniref:Uncharacterized protein n=1 Tax=Ancylostoma ceylanicum TaxID=53326 RepID=A0A016T2L2_9BILA|nr:hypothetical protein Y032_0145g2484 [Ancylostoma ceylanicum]
MKTSSAGVLASFDITEDKIHSLACDAASSMRKKTATLFKAVMVINYLSLFKDSGMEFYEPHACTTSRERESTGAFSNRSFKIPHF